MLKYFMNLQVKKKNLDEIENVKISSFCAISKKRLQFYIEDLYLKEDL